MMQARKVAFSSRLFEEWDASLDPRILELQSEQDTGGGLKPRFNPGSNSGAGSDGGEGEYQDQEPGFNPGSTQV